VSSVARHESTCPSRSTPTRDLIDQQVPEVIGEALDGRGERDKLEVEITESVVMADPVRARGVLTGCVKRGFTPASTTSAPAIPRSAT
jgi:hypothetical protein